MVYYNHSWLPETWDPTASLVIHLWARLFLRRLRVCWGYSIYISLLFAIIPNSGGWRMIIFMSYSLWLSNFLSPIKIALSSSLSLSESLSSISLMIKTSIFVKSFLSSASKSGATTIYQQVINLFYYCFVINYIFVNIQ
jgi:hypothetical protein